MGEIKGNASISKMIFLDTETTSTPASKKHWRGSGTPNMAQLRLGIACTWKINTNGNPTEKWYEFKTKEDFYNIVEGFKGNQNQPIFIYTYNASFDYQILGLVAEMGKRPDWTYDKAPIIGNVFIFETKYRGSTVYWLDMGNHLGVKRPLKDIGAELGLEKLDVDSSHLDDYTDAEVATYCRRDVEIVRTYMLKWLNFLRDNGLGVYRPTLAGQCLAAYRHRFIETPIYVHNIPRISLLERAAYKGGRNEAFFIGEIEDRVYKLDVNSFHPYIMANLPLPHKLIRAGEYLTESAFVRYLDSGHLGIIECNITVPSSARCICVREPIEGKIERSIFPIGTYNATITSIEYQQLKAYGGTLNDISQYAIYESAVLFKRYMDFFYQNRLRFKAAHDLTSATNCKYFMNSLEGKFAQHTKDTIVINESSDRENGDHIVIDADTNERVIIHVYGGKEWVKTKTKQEGFNVFVSISAFIRAYTRVILYEDFNTIWNAGGDVYYCDTDSIFTNSTGYRALDLDHRLDSDRLGAYKLEDTSDTVVINGCKDYSFEGVEKIKGIRSNARCVNGVYYQTHFCRMTAMMQRGIDTGVIIVEDFAKKPSRRYWKGVVGEDGWVMPHVLSGV